MSNYPPQGPPGQPYRPDPSVIPPGMYQASDGRFYPLQGSPQPMLPPPKKGGGKTALIVIGSVLVGVCVLVALAIVGGTGLEDKNKLDQAGPASTGSSGTASSVSKAGKSNRTFDRTNYEELASDPERFEGASVNIVGRVFGEVRRDPSGVYFQMFAMPKMSQGNTLVKYADTSSPIKDGDYAHVQGRVDGAASGQNLMGGTVHVVKVVATSLAIVDALAAATPASRTAPGGSSQTQHGLTVTIEKVDFAVDETRVHLVIKNDSPTEAMFSSYGAKATRADQQFEAKSNFDYPEIPSSILPGVRSAGILVFPAIGPGAVTFIFEASSNNYSARFTPYRFSVTS